MTMGGMLYFANRQVVDVMCAVGLRSRHAYKLLVPASWVSFLIGV